MHVGVDPTVRIKNRDRKTSDTGSQSNFGSITAVIFQVTRTNNHQHTSFEEPTSFLIVVSCRLYPRLADEDVRSRAYPRGSKIVPCERCCVAHLRLWLPRRRDGPELENYSHASEWCRNNNLRNKVPSNSQLSVLH